VLEHVADQLLEIVAALASLLDCQCGLLKQRLVVLRQLQGTLSLLLTISIKKCHGDREEQQRCEHGSSKNRHWLLVPESRFAEPVVPAGGAGMDGAISEKSLQILCQGAGISIAIIGDSGHRFVEDRFQVGRE
jgi:hypothetical protein